MIRSMEEFVSVFHAARCVSTPLVAIRTADPASTTYFLTDALKQSRQPPPLLGWDVIRGLYAIGKDSGEELARVLGDREVATVGPADALSLAQQLGENGLLLYCNAHRFWDEPGVMQGIWNLRDSFNATGRMLVLLAVPGATLPTLTWQYISYGVPEQLGEISARIFETEREKAAKARSQACDEIQRAMRASLLEIVNHLCDRPADQPDGKPQRLRESTVQKLRDFLATFDLRNVVDDQGLKEPVERARALLEGVSADELRNMPLVRASVREGMASIAAQMDVLVNDRVSSKFRFDEA